jgi:hypothetical protein
MNSAHSALSKAGTERLPTVAKRQNAVRCSTAPEQPHKALLPAEKGTEAGAIAESRGL